MPTSNSLPTSNTTPDPVQGGSAVTTATNTGHGNTPTNAANGASLTRSCIWTTFQSVGGTITSINLKADWIINSGLLDAASTNEFRFQYSVDGGSNWTTAVIRSDVTASDSGSVNVSLGAAQDISLVQMRDHLVASADIGAGTDAQINAAVSDIRLEVVTADPATPIIGRAIVLM